LRVHHYFFEFAVNGGFIGEQIVIGLRGRQVCIRVLRQVIVAPLQQWLHIVSPRTAIEQRDGGKLPELQAFGRRKYRQ